MEAMTLEEREERAHRPISPSGLKRILHCPGSFALSERVGGKFESSKSAIEGNLTGALLEHALNKIFDNRFAYKVKVGTDFKILVQSSLETLGIPDEDGKRVERVVEVIHYLTRWREEVIEVYPGAEFFHFAQEQFVECWALEGSDEGVGGSADILIAWRCGTDVSFAVMDLKDGNVPVYAGGDAGLNPQLIAYAAGFVRYLVEQRLALPKSFSYVHLHILQPKTDNWDSAIVRWNEETIIRGPLLSLVKDLKEKTNLAWSLRDKEDVTEYLKVNEECRYCKAKLICPKAFEASSPAIVPIVTPSEVPSVPMIVQAMTMENKIKLVENRKLIEEVIKEVRKEMVADLLSGKQIPGVKLVNSKPDQTVWDDVVPVEQRKKVLKDIGVNPVKEQDRSCADVKKEVGEEALKELGLVTKKSFGLTVVGVKERGKEILISGNSENLFIASEEEEE